MRMTSTESVKNQPPTSFIGRERELSELMQRLRDPDCRLLTLVGPGGIGKTRLALRAFDDLEEEFTDGAQFIPLQSATDRSDLVAATADALGVSLTGRREAAVQLINFLQDKNLLLVLDNVEQLLPDGAELIASILVEAPAVSLLVTSRHALNLQGEWRYRLQGLPVPDSSQVQNLRSFASVKLFQQRARQQRPEFSLDSESADVVRICQLTEGVPLALELAASWIETLPCRAIAEQIDHGLDILTTDVSNVPDRHRSMRAVIDRSWRLLSDRERDVLQRLSVFRAGFQREAAEAVANASLDLLSALIDKSLLRREPDGRFRLHELLREYGSEKLHHSESGASPACQLHASYYATLFDDRLNELHGERQREALEQLDVEWENMRAAWRWALTRGDVDLLNNASTSFFLFCQLRSRYRQGLDALADAADRLVQQPDGLERNRALARLYNHTGWLRIRIGQFKLARRDLERSWELYSRPAIELPAHMGSDPRSGLAILASIQGDHERAASLGHDVRRSAEPRQDKHNLAFAHYVLTSAEAARGELELARQHAERACGLARETGNEWFLAHPLIEWGHVERALGGYEQARKHYEASYSIKKSFDDPQGMAAALNHRGEIALLQGDHAAARALFERSRDLHQQVQDPGGLAAALKGIGLAACAVQDTDRGRRPLREALEIAFDIEFTPLVLSIFVDVDMLLRQLQAAPLSVALLTFAEHHPASDHQTAAEAARRLEQHETELAETEFADAAARGRAWDLEQAANALQAELAGGTRDRPGALADRGGEQSLIEPLTAREMEVLGLLAQGHTNAQIADELVLALGTVKWYASEIYGKLGVTNRTQAAHRARELELIPSADGRGHQPQPR